MDLGVFEVLPYAFAPAAPPTNRIGPNTLEDLTRNLRATVRACRLLTQEREDARRQRDEAHADLALLDDYVRAPSSAAMAAMNFLSCEQRTEVAGHLDRFARLNREVHQFEVVCRESVVARVAAHQAALDDIAAQLVDVNGAIAAAEVQDTTRGLCPAPRGLCPICIEAEVDSVTMPCGHLFCRECVHRHPEANGQHSCSMCRQPVQRVSRVYFGL
jgi:hypothetical protein